jgi:hypothetical protein
VLDLLGFTELHPELNRLSKAGRWDDMTDLIPDELVELIAVVGPRSEIAARLVERAAGLDVTVSLVNNRNPDPTHFADIVAAPPHPILVVGARRLRSGRDRRTRAWAVRERERPPAGMIGGWTMTERRRVSP